MPLKDVKQEEKKSGEKREEEVHVRERESLASIMTIFEKVITTR